MFIVEGRTVGVFAALGVVFSMVLLDRLSDVADSTEPRSLPAFTTAIATALPGMRHDDELAPPCSGDSTASAACPPTTVSCPMADARIRGTVNMRSRSRECPTASATLILRHETRGARRDAAPEASINPPPLLEGR
jgi:hypothetical protein